MGSQNGRLAQMFALLTQVLVMTQTHCGVAVAQQLGNLDDANAVLQGVGHVAVPVGVTDHALEMGQLFAEVTEAAADAVPSEARLAPWAAEEWPVRMFRHKPFRQLRHSRSQVDNTRLARLLGRLVFPEDPNAQVKVNVLGGYLADFGRATPSFLHGEDEVAKTLVLDGPEDLLALLGRQDAFATTCGWFADFLDGIFRKKSFVLGPVESPLDRRYRTPSGAIAPAIVTVEPPRDVERLELHGPHGAVEVTEILKEVLVPGVGLRGIVALAPVKEQVADLSNGQGRVVLLQSELEFRLGPG
jgi:hypothetical protein